jgi:hypothetical protein
LRPDNFNALPPDKQQQLKDQAQALAHLNNVEKGIAIVNAAVALAQSIADGDIGSVGDNVQNLIQTISPTNKS